jgi:membrane protein YdbS with pleckstrin-like domain
MKKIHPKPIVEQTKIFIFLILLSIVLFLIREFLSDIFVPIITLVWVIGLIQIIYLSIHARFISLDIGENDLLFRKGVLSMKTNLVPYKKITDARFGQSIIERVFQVGTLEIDTAGSDRVSIRIPSVPFKDLERIISIVRSKRGDEPHEE